MSPAEVAEFLDDAVKWVDRVELATSLVNSDSFTGEPESVRRGVIRLGLSIHNVKAVRSGSLNLVDDRYELHATELLLTNIKVLKQLMEGLAYPCHMGFDTGISPELRETFGDLFYGGAVLHSEWLSHVRALLQWYSESVPRPTW